MRQRKFWFDARGGVRARSSSRDSVVSDAATSQNFKPV